ncbi:hypothetical protein [Exiguobacterium sp. AM39-5BH]|uniref:hypothetical protein n=1 Tax=Exiguobacterium sp. AM39-5BH TaxID=2292355 RepID=UPI0018F36DD5|nr:hypothetical protein [Exiguobacterium sp. AM39-5BH]
MVRHNGGDCCSWHSCFIVSMSRYGEKLEGDEDTPPVRWADEKWYKPEKEDGPLDG